MNNTKVQFTLLENVVIKNSLPERGIVCSNPLRTERLVNAYVQDAQVHTDNWGIRIQTGFYKNYPIFVASVPMGASGSGFAFLEMYAAEAKYIIRYGSNDRYVTADNLKDIIIIDEVNNLYGLMRDSGVSHTELGKSLSASPVLIASLQRQALLQNYPIELRICHHVEDYHAYNYPHLIPKNSDKIQSLINSLEGQNPKKSAWDMETAALFWRAIQFQQHGATVLQSLIKHRGQSTPYDGEYGRIALKMETIISQLIFESLITLET